MRLSSGLRAVMWGTAAINLVVGAMFLFDPELDVAPWPNPISPVLVRFIGAIILGNAAGAAVVAAQGTWEGARALFAVALVYGVVAIIAVPAQLAAEGGPRSLWVYVVIVAIFLVPIGTVIWNYERRTPHNR